MSVSAAERSGRTVEELIRAAFPDDADRKLRICLLRAYHAAENAQRELDGLARALAAYLRDPAPNYSGALLGSSAEDTVRKLVTLAAEVRKSAHELPGLARGHYRRRAAAARGEGASS